MKKSELTREKRVLNARRKGWEYLKEYFNIDFRSYCRFLDKLNSGQPKSAVWMEVW